MLQHRLDLKVIIQSEISQSEKDKHHKISHVESNEPNKLTNKIEGWTHGADSCQGEGVWGLGERR